MIQSALKSDGEVQPDLDEVRWALDISEHVPLIVSDARETGPVRDDLTVHAERTLWAARRP